MSKVLDPLGTKQQSRTHRHYVQVATGDGTTTVFHLNNTPADFGNLAVHVDGAIKAPTLNASAAHDYTFTPGHRTVTFVVAPASGKTILFYVSSV